MRSAEFQKKSSIIKKEERTYIPSKLLHSSSKRSLKVNRSLGNLKSNKATNVQIQIDESKKNEYKTKLDCDLRMPGKKAQCIRKIKSVFSEIIDTVIFNYQITEEVLAIQQAAEQLRDDLLLPLNREMKSLVTAIEKSEGNISVEITASTLDSIKLTNIRDSLKDLSSSFSLSSDFNKKGSNQPKYNSQMTGLQTPRLNAQAPTPVKGSFAQESMGRSSSHDRILVKPKLNLVSASSRDVPLFKKSQGLPVAEVSINPDLLIPSVNDLNFNDFLESELERIKKMFLEDGQPPKSSRTLIKEKQSLLFKEKTPKMFETETQNSNDFTSILAASSRKSTVKKGQIRGSTLQK